MLPLARLRPGPMDLGLAAGLSALWCLHLLGGFAPNTARDATLVTLAYYLLHLLVIGLALWLLRAPLALWLSRRGPPDPRSTRGSLTLSGMALVFGLLGTLLLFLSVEGGIEPPQRHAARRRFVGLGYRDALRRARRVSTK